MFGTGDDVDDVFHEVLSSSGHFTEDIVMDPASDVNVSGGFLAHHLPGEHHFTSRAYFPSPPGSPHGFYSDHV